MTRGDLVSFLVDTGYDKVWVGLTESNRVSAKVFRAEALRIKGTTRISLDITEKGSSR